MPLAQARIRFRHLQAFLEVARQRSVSRAAEILHVSQPAVTKTLRELEDLLGTPLVARDGRGIRITEAGEVFLRHAGASMAALREGLSALALTQGGGGEVLRVGALPTVSARIMPRAVSLYLAGETERGIRVVTGENTVLFNQLRIGDLDLVVGRLAAPEQMAGFNFEHLYSEEIVFVTRPGHPLLAEAPFDFARVDRYQMLLPPPGSIIRPFVDRFLIAQGIGRPVRVVETVSDSFGRGFVAQSDAIWAISRGVVANDIASGLLAPLPVEAPETRGSVGLTTRADTALSAHLTLLMRAIRAASGADAIPSA